MDLLKLQKIRDGYIRKMTTLWAKHLVWTSGSKITVTGLENIPDFKSFCIIANHQSNFDIPIIMANIPLKTGFVGKYEMLKVPFLSTWMKALNCVFIKRQNIRHSIEGLKNTVEKVKGGNSMVLFPEGTRSRHGLPGKFHHAGIRMAIEQNIPILPVSIINSFEMFESKKRIVPVNVELMIHPVPEYNPDILNLEIEKIISTITGPLRGREKE